MKSLPHFKDNENKAIKELKEILSNKFKITQLKVFGSKVRGTDTEESDIDVMVEVNELNPEIMSEIYDVIFEINLENDSFISPTIFGKKEINDGPLSESPIYKIIQKEGISI